MTEIIASFLIIVSLFHFIYEAIVLPSIRQHYRNRLFALRDRLRSIYINQKDAIDYEIFNLIHDSLSNFINRIHTLTISTEAEFVRMYNTDENFRKIIDKRRTMVDGCEHKELKRIVEQANAILKRSFIANAGAWFIYIIPIVLMAHFFQKISRTAKEIFVLSGNELDGLIPVTE